MDKIEIKKPQCSVIVKERGIEAKAKKLVINDKEVIKYG